MSKKKNEYEILQDMKDVIEKLEENVQNVSEEIIRDNMAENLKLLKIHVEELNTFVENNSLKWTEATNHAVRIAENLGKAVEDMKRLNSSIRSTNSQNTDKHAWAILKGVALEWAWNKRGKVIGCARMTQGRIGPWASPKSDKWASQTVVAEWAVGLDQEQGNFGENDCRSFKLAIQHTLNTKNTRQSVHRVETDLCDSKKYPASQHKEECNLCFACDQASSSLRSAARKTVCSVRKPAGIGFLLLRGLSGRRNRNLYMPTPIVLHC
nr:hypothetical protein Iba_chr15bCG1200 [Ipomoea batatas]